MVFRLICNILFIAAIAAISIVAYIAAVRADRLTIDNERLRKMNDGQRRAIEELQERMIQKEFL